MSSAMPCPEPCYSAGNRVLGFRVENVTQVPEIRSTAYEIVHLETGARILHLHCRDRENFYAVTFRTPPTDSTGVAHILEHSVLAGSESYPVRDAFNELAKGSMQTFLNALTGPDFTCYPVASQVPADFYNLASVYTDLVFRPLLKRNTFLQEGHHMEIDESGRLSISGIVYNEMKGAFSSPETISQRATTQGISPEGPYGVESGGHPEHIPDLTYEQFIAFHRKYYSPSNAWIYFYGDLPTKGHLEFLAPRLEGFGRTDVESSTPLQPRWDAPRKKQELYPAGPDDPLEKRSTVNVAWLSCAQSEGEERLILEVLQEALIGNDGAPLRRVLVESGLGEDLSPTAGLLASYRELPFVVGLRGTDTDKAGAIEELTLNTLKDAASNGIPDDVLEAAFHQVEFHGLEITWGFGLNLLFRSMGDWLHGLDPVPGLRLSTLIEGLRERWKAEPDLFRNAVQKWLVDNPHRLLAVITPSRTLTEDRRKRLDARLTALSAGLSPEQKDEVRARAAELLEEQRRRETPESLATLPRLEVTEIPRSIEIIPTVERNVEGVRILEHDIFTNGIAYVDLAFDLSDVPEDLQPYLPMLGAAAAGMGAGGRTYEVFATHKALRTGGVSCELRARELQRGSGTAQTMLVRANALKRNLPQMVEILADILTAGDLDDHGRMRDVLAEMRNQMRAALAPGGHRFALRAAAAGLSTASYRDEQWHGASQIRFLNELQRQSVQDAGKLAGKLRRLRELIFRRDRLVVNLTGDESLLSPLRDLIGLMIKAMPAGGSAGAVSGPRLGVVHRGIAIPGDVCYVARVFRAPRFTDPGASRTLALAGMLADGILYKKIRVEGGAYGGFAVHQPSSGLFCMLSYRDPNLEKTIGVYDSAFDDFLSEALDPEEVRKVIISTIGSLDLPLEPASKGYAALERHLIGLTDDDRRTVRAEILDLDAAALRAAAEELGSLMKTQSAQAVLAPRERIEAANQFLDASFAIEELG